MLEIMDRFRGCLLGLAAGEAIGLPLAGMDSWEIERKLGKATGVVGDNLAGEAQTGALPLTGQMLCVAESYIQDRAFDPVDIADRLLAWYRSGPADIDNLTHEALENLLFGYNFERSGRDAWEAVPDGFRMGNGSLGRAAPTGLARYHDHVHLVGESRIVSGITHFDERCKLSCVCLNLGISHLLLADAHGLPEEILEWIEPRNTVLGYSIGDIQHLGPEDLITKGSVVDTLQAALWAAVHCDSFEEGILVLVNLGGDTKTLGAVAGALLGARFGVKAIPKEWLDAVPGKDYIDSIAKEVFLLSEDEG